jgi:hypothetical protein
MQLQVDPEPRAGKEGNFVYLLVSQIGTFFQHCLEGISVIGNIGSKLANDS